MTPKEELIQAIERSPDELVRALLELLRVMQPFSEAMSPVQQETVLERMGGELKHMLSVGGLSNRDRRRSLIATRLKEKHGRDS
jgi:hypothetical protein